MDNHNTGSQLPYEDKPLRLKPVLIAVFALVVVGAIVHFLMWAEFSALDKQRKSQDPRVSPLAPARQIPPGPHLEAVRPAMPGAESEPFVSKNLATVRADERNMLDSYAWVDDRNGIVRIPIHQAMKKVIEREQGRQPGGSQTQTATD